MHHTNRVRQGQNFMMTGGFEIYVVDMYLTKQKDNWRPTVIAEIVNVREEEDQSTIGKIVTLEPDEFDTLSLDDSLPLVKRQEAVKQVTTTKATTRKTPAKKPTTRRSTAAKKTTARKATTTRKKSTK